MTTLYKINQYNNQIQPVEVERQTAHYVWFKNERGNVMQASKVDHYPEWEAARAVLLDRAKRTLAEVERNLAEQRKRVSEIEALTPPASAWTEEELKEFDRLVDMVSSPNQAIRSTSRITMNRFVAEHGKEKCDAMWAHLEAKGKTK